MENKEWKFSHNFVDAGAMLQSSYININDPSLQLNVLDNEGNAILFRDGVFLCCIPRLYLHEH
jgi:hypothetical protein